MKHITTLILAAVFALSSVSCQSTGVDNKIVAALAKAGNAYVQASPKISAQNKVYVALAYQTIASGKIDQASLAALAKEAIASQLGKNLSESEREAVMSILTQIESGGLNKESLVPIAKTAVMAYAASQGVPPEQVAALTALAEALAA